MTDKPIVTARYDREFTDMRDMCGSVYTTPSIHISVEFSLHQHEAALAALEQAAADVRAQIEETK